MSDIGTHRSGRLIAVVRDLSAAHDRASICESIRSAARDLIRADGVTFVFREGDQCYYAEEDAIGPLWKGKRFPLTACISGWAMLHNERVVLPDIYADERVPHDAYRPTFVKSLVMIPVGHEKPVAALGAYWATARQPTDDELSIGQALADAATLALANADLYERLQQSLEEAKAANRARDQFLAIIAHELRQPLNAIALAAQVMEAQSERISRQEARRVIARQVLQLSRLISDLLDASGLEQDKLVLRRQRLDFKTVVESSVYTIRSTVDERGQPLHVDLPAEALWVKGDPDRLQQVVSNLLANAVQHTSAQAPIGVVASREGGHVVLRVTDAGEGIDPELLPHIFDLFRQARPREDGGFGLGLAIVRSIVALHGGTVAAHSEGRGRGSVFTVTLPADTL